MTSEHATEVLRIYAEGIATRLATFETETPSWERWNEGHLPHSRLVALDGDRLFGWAALSSVSDRCVYGGVAEVSVYVGKMARGRGVGKALLRALCEASESNGIWTLQAGIFANNEASIRLHQACGFRIVGTRRNLGQLDGQWRDVMLMERRSTVVGVS
ncbi:MAG: N-acetyltransferase [Candidatus Eisenbacteria bacterium]|uniref:N-acetyltransferase n=1 Tax=Eiseniibacteriota bacterium TaxID=2212470 RepID=A0A7Y2E8T6_UNCEI|nr:N-acetyltransferase [Candidatus Eisenbacteria bacterium]